MKTIRFCAIFLMVAYAALVLTGYKRFVVWPQITDYYYDYAIEKNSPWLCETILEQQQRLGSKVLKIDNVNLKDISNACKSSGGAGLISRPLYPSQESLEGVLADLSHKVRVTIFFPLISIGANLGLNIHFIFSIFCLFSIGLMSFLLSRLFRSAGSAVFHVYITLFSVLSLFMNGRMIISYLSISIIIWTICCSIFDLRKKTDTFLYLLTVFIGLSLSNVSSGINFVVLALFLYDIFKSSKFWLLPIFGKIGIIFLLVLQCFVVSIGIAKNILYFGGDIEAPIRMINHGFGRILNYPIFIIIAMASLLVVGLLCYKYRYYLQDTLWVGFFVFAIGGAFGLSVLAGTLVFLILILTRKFISRFHLKCKTV